MHVQPVSTRPGGRGSGATTKLVLALPVAALVATVAVAWAGRLGEAPAEPPAPRVALSATPGPGMTATARPAATSDAQRLTPVPSFAFRLPVRSVPEALAALGAGDLPRGLFAMAGYFSSDARRSGCVTGDGVGLREAALCRRSGILATSSAPVLAVDHYGIEPHVIHLTTATPMIAAVIPPAVPLPTILQGPDSGRGVVDPVPIVVVGWVQDETPRYCLPGTPTCRGTIVVERVAWAAGEWIAGAFPGALTARSPSASFAAAIERTPDRGLRIIASRETDRGEPVLSQALLSYDELRAVGQDAADAISPAARPTPGQPVWYVRSVGRPTVAGGPRLVAWTVIDRRTGLVLALGDADGG